MHDGLNMNKVTLIGLENHLERDQIPKIKKTVKINVKMPHVNKNQETEGNFFFKHHFLFLLFTSDRKQFFLQTPFSLLTLKSVQKNFTLQNPLAFSLHFLFRREQNHYSNLTSKFIKICEQFLQKR